MGAPDWSELIERVGRLDTIRISGRVMGARGTAHRVGGTAGAAG
jgi:hypothetical protein